jgi:transposase-like protein
MGRQSFRRRRHTPAFKVEAVRVMRERLGAGLTLERVGDELEVGPDLLRQWAKQVAGAPPDTPADEIFPGHGGRRRFAPVATLAAPDRPPAPEEELARLRRENERLRLERDFLKKAAAFFARESR